MEEQGTLNAIAFRVCVVDPSPCLYMCVCGFSVL